MKRFYLSLLMIVGVMITALWIHYSIGSNTQALISSLDNLYEIASYADEDTLAEETQLLANQWRKSKKFLKCVTLHSYAWPGGPQTAVTPVITLGPLWELTAEVPQWPRPNLRGGMGCKGSRFQGPQWLAKVLGAPLPGVWGPSLPEAGFGGSGETAGGHRAPAWPHPPPGQGPTQLPIFWSGGLVGAGPGLLLLPRTLPTGWAHCPAERGC